MQLIPEPLYPSVHMQMYDPSVLVQLALMSQGESEVHSSMSNEIMHLSSYVLPPPLGARHMPNYP